ncbi:unnamed protein product, partial [marine sediment metagenome]
MHRPDGISFTYDGGYALVGSESTPQIAVIDTSTHALVDTIMVSSPPTSIATSPIGTYAYATTRYDNSVSVLDVESMSVVDTIPVGWEPWDVVLSPDGQMVYVSNRGDRSVSVIDASTNSVIHTIANFATEPYGLDISPDGSYLYVAGGSSGAVHVIDTTSNTVVGNLGMSPHWSDYTWDVAITREGDFLYVANSNDEPDGNALQVFCIDTSNNLIAATIAMPDTDGDGYPAWDPLALAICPQRVEVYPPEPIPFYFSVKEDVLSFANDDIVVSDGTDFALFFDGSDVGLADLAIDALAVVSEREILMSFSSAGAIPGIAETVEPADLVKFTATRLRPRTAGSFELYFDGSDVGLSGENVDAVELLEDGRLLLSATSRIS